MVTGKNRKIKFAESLLTSKIVHLYKSQVLQDAIQKWKPTFSIWRSRKHCSQTEVIIVQLYLLLFVIYSWWTLPEKCSVLFSLCLNYNHIHSQSGCHSFSPFCFLGMKPATFLEGRVDLAGMYHCSQEIQLIPFMVAPFLVLYLCIAGNIPGIGSFGFFKNGSSSSPAAVFSLLQS